MHPIEELKQEIDKRGLIVQAIVGDRYKQVLNVSQSVVHLDKSIEEIQNTIDDIRSLSSRDTPVNSLPSTHIDPIPALVKLVHDSTENIWRLIENEQHLHAAWLYSLAKITHMQLSSTYPDTLNQLVILKSQHESTLQLKPQIVLKAVISLIKQSITFDDARSTLTALILLDSPSYGQSLDKLLTQRTTALTHIQNNPSVELIISQSLQLINETHELVHKLYIQDELSRYIGQCSGNTADITTNTLINQLSGSEIIIHRIPNQLLNYTPYFAPFDKIPNAQVNQTLDKWIASSLDFLKSVLDAQNGLLADINNISDLCPLRAIVEITNIEHVKNFFVSALEERCEVIWKDLHNDYLETTQTKVNKAMNTVTNIPNAKNDPIKNLLAPLPENLDTTTLYTEHVPIVSEMLTVIKNQSTHIHDQIYGFLWAPNTALQSKNLLNTYHEYANGTLTRFLHNLDSTFDKVLQNANTTQRKRQLMVFRHLLEALQKEETIARNIMLNEETQQPAYMDVIKRVNEKWVTDVVNDKVEDDSFVWSTSELDADETRWSNSSGGNKIPEGPSRQLIDLLSGIAHDVENISLHLQDNKGLLKSMLSQLWERMSRVFDKEETDERAKVRKSFDIAFLNVLCGQSGMEVEMKGDNTEELRVAAFEALKKYQVILGALINAPGIPAAGAGATGRLYPFLRLGQPAKKVELNSMIVPTVELKPRISLLTL
ncbi:hypothetical protein E3Q15_02128 [Wallemia mellicola]|nr:hypothetical protein E3Q15_02128 [Wallemia mellicola]